MRADSNARNLNLVHFIWGRRANSHFGKQNIKKIEAIRPSAQIHGDMNARKQTSCALNES